MTVVVDTSVWIDHLVRGDVLLTSLLNQGLVLAHPMVTGEIACGSLRARHDILNLLSGLPQAPAAKHDEVLAFIERHALWGRGLGFTDMHLLASSALAAPARLLTRDRSLGAAAADLGLAYVDL